MKKSPLNDTPLAPRPEDHVEIAQPGFATNAVANELPASYSAVLRQWLALSAEKRLDLWRARRNTVALFGEREKNSPPQHPRRTHDEDADALNALFGMAPLDTPSVLGGRYKLTRQLPSDGTCEMWLAVDLDGVEHLAKFWRYNEESVAGPARALWNTELRMLYRLASSRNSQSSLLVLRDAGVDRDLRAFVMILFSEGSGYERLAGAFRNRGEHEWLMLRNLREGSKRAELWGMLERLANGIDALHTQGVIHRCICAEQVFFDPAGGLASLRLGGFEWSIRLGFTAGAGGTPLTWPLPPEVADFRTGFSFDSDWYAFGMLAARCFFDLEHLGEHNAQPLNEEVLRVVADNSGGLISDLEKDLLLRLAATQPEDRLVRGQEILARIERIRRQISTGSSARARVPLVLTLDVKNSDVVNAAIESGFVPNPQDSQESYSALNRDHVTELKNFLREKLRDGRLYPGPDSSRFVLVGQPNFTVLISAYRDPFGDGTATWDVAFIRSSGELRTTKPELCRDDLRGLPLAVLELKEVSKHRDRQSWESFLPVEATMRGRRDLDRFHDFLRCTNMLELLMSCSEIFEYREVSRSTKAGEETLVIEESVRQRKFPAFCHTEGGLRDLLHRELESRKPGCQKVLLTSEENLHLVGIEDIDFWIVDEIDHSTGHIRLTRQDSDKRSGRPAPNEGFIRTFGLNGQVRLIDRRKRAIDRLDQHFYLLSALAQPGIVSMDTGTPTGLFPLPKDEVDESKRAVIEDIERVRPIYALQGPPGTGKTTLVAWKLRRLFHEDPLAQVLVTAQAHGAVDVLRGKVRNEAFRDVADDDLPISIRLGARPDAAGARDIDSVPEAAERLLMRARDRLHALAERTQFQEKWLNVLEEKLGAASSRESDGFFQDFNQLVKFSAGITYCTTSAGDLAELAHGSQDFDWSFDWAIVEEAGKVHGFDLALPLQTGHRWLLLGDHKQLPPFRIEDFKAALDDLDAAVRALGDLPDRGLLDHEWLEGWRDETTPQERQNFVEYSRVWLETFGRLFESLRRLHAEPRLTTTEAVGAQAGLLSCQWRMHPQIGNLISETFYEGKVRNGTADERGHPKPHVLHHLRLEGASAPNGIEGKAIVWLDMPWCGDDHRAADVGPDQNKPRFTNPREANVVKRFIEKLRVATPRDKACEIAVLSPYNHQVALLNQRLSSVDLLEGFRRVTVAGRSGANERWAHTVDSFQGNQADVIIVSLVRNNMRDEGAGLGFLDKAPRLNVLLSRAEKLLVLVGSWKFFEQQVQHVRLDNETDRLWFWKKAFSVLAEAFKEGHALRLPADYLFTNEER